MLRQRTYSANFPQVQHGQNHDMDYDLIQF